MSKKKKKTVEELLLLDIKEQIHYIHEYMKDLLIKAGIPEKIYNRTILHMKEEEQEIIKEFLIDLYHNEFELLRKAWNNLPPHVWESYKLLDEFNMPEQRHLLECQANVRKKWRERSFQKSHKKPSKQS